MGRKRRRKRSKQASPTPAPLAELLNEGRTNTQTGQYPEAIAAYKEAADYARSKPGMLRKRYEWLWPTLAELHVRVGQIDRGQAFYQEHLTFLLESGCSGGKFWKAIQASHDVAGADLQIDLIAPFQETKKLNVVHQLPRASLEELFSRAIEAYDSNPDPFTLTLISELLPRVTVDPPPTQSSLETLLAQPGGLKQILEGLGGDEPPSIPAPAALPLVDEDERQQKLREIWEERVHGTRMYRGGGYEIRAAIFFLLDMLDDTQGIARIEIEGIEDFDIYYDSRSTSFPPLALPPRVYVQVKSRDLDQPAWSVDQLKNVLNNFAEIHCEDPEANFSFVTDHHFGQRTTLSGVLGHPSLWAFDRDHPVRDEVMRVLKPDFTTNKQFDLDIFLKRVHFRVLKRDLEYLLIERLAAWTSSPKGIAARYYDALFEEVHNLAETAKVEGAKKAFSKPDLERFLHKVIMSVDLSAIEEPLRHGNLELLTFSVIDETPPRSDPNYYLGVYADVRHILAGQDIHRPELMEDLAIKLVQRNFCVLRSPSGTGKTTLMYRFAYEHRHSFAVYRLRRLDGDSETIEACVRYIKALQPSEHSPVLLLIDDISRPEKRGWQELLKPVLENPNVYVIATTREDEWSDFLALGINVEYVHLALSEDTAQRFHLMLKEREQLHPDYPDWREAYEASKADGTALFMEYTHILTQGKHIQEVLNEQVERLASKSAPDGAIQTSLLRLICTAHAFGGRVPADLLPSLVDSQGENLGKHLKSLADEHLVVREQEYYIGLHEVRSRFLRDLTHQYPPPSLRQTLTQLIAHLPLVEVAPILEGACRHCADIAVQILEPLALRLNKDGEIIEIAEIIRRLYMASEWHYARKIKGHLDQFDVNPSEVNIFAVELAPILPSPTGILDMELFRADARTAFATAPPRGSNRFEQQLGLILDTAALAERIDAEADTAAVVYLLNWLREANPLLAEELVANTDISRLARTILAETSGQRVASLLFHVWRCYSNTYNQLIATLGGQEIVVDKLLAAYPLVTTIEWDHSASGDDVVHLYFWAEDPLDELGDEVDVHNKAIFLAGTARRMFPTVTRVKTTGLFHTGREYKVGVHDPATKNIPVEKLVVLEDAEKNQIWLRAIATQYTSKTWYAYLRQQDAMRVKYLNSLGLMAVLLQSSQGKPSSTQELAYPTITYQALIQEESRTLLFPPDPDVAFWNPQEDWIAYRDLIEIMRKHILQGLYHVTLSKRTDGDHYFRNYIGAVDRCVQFLCEYLVSGDIQKVGLLRSNAMSLLHELGKYHCERGKSQLRQAEHMDLLPIELHLAGRVQEATQYIFDHGYRDLWSEAEAFLKKTHLLVNRLYVLRHKMGLQQENVSFELARVLNDELITELPSIDVLVHLGTDLQDASTNLNPEQIRDYAEQLGSLIALDYFVALAQKRQRARRAAQLEEIEAKLRAEGVHIEFGPPILEKEEVIGVTWETLPIMFQVSDLTDIQKKGPIVFRHIFAEKFSNWQKFALVVTDGQAIVWPVVWTFNYRDRPRWDLVEQLGNPASYLEFCMSRIDLLDKYSAHFGLPIAEEPEYIQAMQAFCAAAINASTDIARLRHDIRLHRKSPEEAEHLLKVGESSEVEDEEASSLQAQIDFLTGFQASTEFQGFHNDVLDFLAELSNAFKREIDALGEVADDPQASTEIRTLPDMVLDSLADSLDASLSSKRQVRARLSAAEQVTYEDMDIPSKFEILYFFVKNYFHFGRTEYG